MFLLLVMMTNTEVFTVPGTRLSNLPALGHSVACILALPSPSGWIILPSQAHSFPPIGPRFSQDFLLCSSLLSAQ